MNEPVLHLVKLCVGVDEVADLARWQTERSIDRKMAGLDPRPRHVTRMWPRRGDELLQGGSLYWVIRGITLARQRLEMLEEVTGPDGIRRCALILNPEIVRTAAAPRRPFQGWRYLQPEDAPPDLAAGVGGGEDELPAEMAAELTRLGVV